MFIGHALLAFVVAALLGRWVGFTRERALAFGVLAGTFAVLPDVDILYAPVGLLGTRGVFEAVEAFWATGNVVHRSVTHALPVAAVLAVTVGLWSRHVVDPGRRGRITGALALGAIGALVALALVTAGAVAALVMAAFALAALATATIAAGSGLAPRSVAAMAAIGLLSHPFGDLLTGEPPLLLYPFEMAIVAERLTIHPDPTIHLLTAFGLELAIVWLAVAVYLDLRGRSVLSLVGPRATLGMGYGAAVLAIPAPSVDAAYLFVGTVVAVGVLGLVRLRRRGGSRRRPWLPAYWVGWARRHGAVVTGLTAVTVAWLAYSVAYLVF